jgi:hypothetical protein
MNHEEIQAEKLAITRNIAKALLWWASKFPTEVPTIDLANAVEQARAIVCIADGGEIDPQDPDSIPIKAGGIQ